MLGPVHRQIGITQEFCRVLLVAPAYGDADASCDKELAPTKGEGARSSPKIRSAMRLAPSASVSSRRKTNSSPPRRAIVSSGLRNFLILLLTNISSRSPV